MNKIINVYGFVVNVENSNNNTSRFELKEKNVADKTNESKLNTYRPTSSLNYNKVK